MLICGLIRKGLYGMLAISNYRDITVANYLTNKLHEIYIHLIFIIILYCKFCVQNYCFMISLQTESAVIQFSYV